MDFGYFLDVDADDTVPSSIGAKLPFQWQPLDLSTSHDSGFKTIAVPGQSHGLQQFAAGGAMEEHLKLTFVGDDADPAWAQDRGDWLLSLTLLFSAGTAAATYIWWERPARGNQLCLPT